MGWGWSYKCKGFWQLVNLLTIAVVLLAVPGSSAGFSVTASLEPSSFVPPIEAEAPTSVFQPGSLPNGSVQQPPVVSPSIKSPPFHQGVNEPLPSPSPRQLTAPQPEHGAPSAPRQPPHVSGISPSAEPQHDLAPPLAAETPRDRTPMSVTQPAAEQLHDSSPQPSVEPPLVSLPPPYNGPPHVSTLKPATEPPHTPEAAPPFPVAESPQAPALPPASVGRPPFPLQTPAVHPDPEHASALPLAAKPPQAAYPPPDIESPPAISLPPPSVAQTPAVPPSPPHTSPIPALLVPLNVSSPLPQPVPSHASPPNSTLPSHASVPPPMMTPLPQEPPPILPSPPPATALPSPPMPPLESSRPPQLVPPQNSPATILVPPPLTVLAPLEPLPSPPPSVPPHASAQQSPPMPMPPLESSPPPQIIPPHTSPATILAPPPFSTPSHAMSAPPPLESSRPFPPPSSIIPPRASFSPPVLTPPLSPPVMPSPTSFPPPAMVPPSSPTSFPPPAMVPPSSPTSFPPPAMVPPGSLSAPPPSVPAYSSSPRPAMQQTVPAVPPHASQRRETNNGAPPPVPTSPEKSPSSRTSSGGAPPVQQVMPVSHPPISHQVDAPMHSAPFLRPNASESPPLSTPAPNNSPVRKGVPVVEPPGSISNPAPAEPKFRRQNGTAPAPVSSQVRPPTVGSHYPPVKGSPRYIAPSIQQPSRPSNFTPPMPSVLSPKSSPSEESHPSASSPSGSTHKHMYPRDKVRSPGPSSDLVPPPAPSQPGRVETPPPYAPKSTPVRGQKYHPSAPPSQGSPVAVVPSPSPSGLPESSLAPSPLSRAPDGHSSTPYLSPKISPSGSSTRNTKKPPAPPIRALPPPPPNQDCAYLTCPEPLTNTPPGSPCGCVWPMEVGLRLSVALYTFFPLVSELAREVAAGVFMKQSQVRVMGANAATQEPEKTIALVDLVPLHDKFDNITAFFTFQRFWHKQVSINKAVFGDYDVLYVRYPGLPPSPPMAPADIAVINGMPYSVGDPNASKVHPLGVDVTKQGHKRRLKGSLIAVIVFSAVGGVLICCAAAWLLIFRHTKLNSQTPQASRAIASLTRSSGRTGHSTESGPSSPLSLGSSLATYAGSAKTFSANEIEKATDNFNPSRILGEGGFGLVYSGTLEDETSIAVKVLKRDDHQGGREFLAEVEMLSRLHHRNLVKLLGICIDERMHCLVYELIPNGSVESHLHGIDKEAAPLDWTSRMKIAHGAARGLAYLHEDSSPRVIHRDFKSSNILLENDFTPKVSDFGLARTAMDEENRHISTRVMGTFGYVAPEYAMTGHLLVKSDVYSYGVVLLELLTGRKPVDMSQPPGQENLVAWTRPLLTNKEGLESIIDPALGSDVPLESVAKVAAIASMCVQPEVSHRPFMGEVVQALKLVCNECDDSKDGDSRRLSRENLSMDFDTKVGMLLGETPDPSQTQLSPPSYLSRDDIEKGLSVSEIFSMSASLGRQTSSSLRRHSASGPMRTARGPRFWQRLRRQTQGSVSEHGVMYRLWAGSH